MGHHKHKLRMRKHHQQEGDAGIEGRFVASSRRCCSCNPCGAVSYLVRGVGRCLFVSCFPVLQCLRLDDYRHRHHDHGHRHFY